MNKIKRIEGTIINSNGLCIDNNNTFLEKTADEMFEELGYSILDGIENFYTNVLIEGKKQKDISFDDVAKDFITIYLTKYNEYGNLETNQIVLSIKELQAINKKCMELRLAMIKINNLKESIEYFKKINNYGTDKEPYYLQYELSEAPISFEWYKAILNKIKKYKPKRVIDIGSNINLFGYLFANEGIEYIGIDIDSDGCKPIETKNIKFVKADYYDVVEQFKNDICISCLCVGYLIPFADVKCKKLIINSDNGDEYNYKCTAKEIKK